MPAKKKSTKTTATSTVKKKAPKVKKPAKVEIEESATIIEEELPIVTPMPTENISPIMSTSQKRAKKRYIITVVIILAIIGLLYAFRSQFIVATVNGQPISRSEFNTEMQKEAGKKSMDALVTKILIIQEANKRNITESDADVNDQVKKIQDQLKKQGQSLDQALAMQGLTMADLKEQIKIEKLIEKLLGDKIKVSDKEVDDYMKKMQDAQAAGGADAATTPKMSRDAVMQQLKQSKLNDQVQPWIQNLQQKAKINYFLNL